MIPIIENDSTIEFCKNDTWIHDEEVSQERFYRESLHKFFDSTYAGAYKDAVIAEFQSYLPDNPPWK
ncbi:hypothetical protein CSA56_00220 [candidate division KSB3 bacterium]|uniref:Uncharacterized protein n=1 Tax=candidate division KSB3 bacterium TaxID=2044937 RepID=A0A2G6KLI0_9BACT|nr:MAG: hypothetical protein CSA56_00220 [candidate division KSB3 bacterium]